MIKYIYLSTRTFDNKTTHLIALSSLSAHATNWVQVGSASNNTDHIDRDSIQTHRFTGGGTYVTAWGKQDYHQAQELNGKKYWQMKAFCIMTVLLVKLTLIMSFNMTSKVMLLTVMKVMYPLIHQKTRREWFLIVSARVKNK